MKIAVASGRRTFAITAIATLLVCSNFLLAQSWAQNTPAQNSAPIAVPQAAAGGELPPADDSLGIANKSLLKIIRDGGFVMYPLFLCSFVLLMFTFERAISLRTGRVIPGPFIKRFLHQLQDGQLDRDEARLVCEENGSSVARIFEAAVRKWGRPAVEVEQAVIDSGERVAGDLRRYLRIFNGVVTIGPLLGLLGTVFGMIRSFSDIAASENTGRLETLSHGISEALFCTATGLSVAIPAVVLHLYFVSRVDRLVIQLDTLGQDVVNTISAEALQEAGQSRRSRKSAA
ncbi:MAG TPA: MotA/TolQ/ExbB proton channel family protein [Pirellulales bacterium]|jgi:biopolymer transport protein ExbB|nr:MotA/TolQ/ExbB proton channel family protein [Pirellulales bacterium]